MTTERERFEEWINAPLERDGEQYTSSHYSMLWQAWQAAVSRAQPAAPAEQEISADEKFCDGHCSWAEHHPDCSLSAPPAQPVAHLWQHGETGRTRIVMPDQIFTADANWLLVGPMYLHPAAAPSVAPEPVAWTLQSELDAAQTTCSAHLWFTNPRNSAWTALFTREQIAAHPPRAPLTEEQIEWMQEAASRINPDELVIRVADLRAVLGISAEGEKP